MQRHRINSNGNCLFDSIRIALESIGKNYRVEDLRYHVAKRVLDKGDSEMTEIIKNWIDIYQNAAKNNEHELVYDYMHVHNISPALTKEDRQRLFRVMMSNLFFGEETTLQSLEKALGVTFEIYTKRGKSSVHHFSNGKKFKPQYSIMLFLDEERRHYDLISFRGKFVHNKM